MDATGSGVQVVPTQHLTLNLYTGKGHMNQNLDLDHNPALPTALLSSRVHQNQRILSFSSLSYLSLTRFTEIPL